MRSRLVSALQLLNMLFIFVTLEVLNEERSRDLRLSHSPNIQYTSVRDEVSNPERSIEVRFLHKSNIHLMVVTDEALIPDILIDLIPPQPPNI